MLRVLVAAITLTACFNSQANADEPFIINLTVSAGKASKTVHGEAVSRLTTPKEREVLTIKAGQRVTVQWKFVYNDPKETLKEVTIHFYAARAEKTSQASLPKLDRTVLAETALNMDFTPKETNEGELHFAIDKPGLYLLRVETIGGIAGVGGHEQFAALDVKVP